VIPRRAEIAAGTRPFPRTRGGDPLSAAHHNVGRRFSPHTLG